jgi:hypothetical protein
MQQRIKKLKKRRPNVLYNKNYNFVLPLSLSPRKRIPLEGGREEARLACTSENR